MPAVSSKYASLEVAGGPAGLFDEGEGRTIGSDRTFGLVLGGFFALVGLLPLIGGHPLRLWGLIVSAAFLAAALVLPRALHPLNKAWMALGALLNLVVSPLVMGLLFLLTVTPMGVGMRLLGKDLLRLKWDRSARTYWIERQPPGPPPPSMKNQF